MDNLRYIINYNYITLIKLTYVDYLLFFYRLNFLNRIINFFVFASNFELTGILCKHYFYVLRTKGVESYPKAYLTTRWTKDVVPRYMDTYKIPNVHTKEKKEEIQSVIRELEFAMEFCIDRMVNDFDKLILFRDEMSEKMTKVDNETKNEKSMKNK